MTIGIDIGTSYSSAAYVREDGTLLIGRAAVATRMKDLSRFKDHFKRDFGADKPYLPGSPEIAPDEIYTECFRYFRQSMIDSTEEKWPRWNIENYRASRDGKTIEKI